MKIKIYNCIGEEYSEEAFDAELHNQILEFGDKKLEVELEDSPQVYGQARNINNVNLMFKDLDETIPDDERKYFTKANWFQKQRIQWMFGKHYFQDGGFKQALLYPIIVGIVIGIPALLYNVFSNKQFDEVEIVSHQIHPGHIIDTIDLRFRNIGTRTSILNSIDINFIKSWDIERDNQSHYDYLKPSQRYELRNFSNQLNSVKNARSKTAAKSLEISQEIRQNEADRILVLINNLELSNIALFTITLNFNRHDKVETDKIIHVFTQENIDDYPYKKNQKIISNILIRDYLDLEIDTISNTKREEIENRITSKSIPINKRIENNTSIFEDASSYDAYQTESFKYLKTKYSKE